MPDFAVPTWRNARRAMAVTLGEPRSGRLCSVAWDRDFFYDTYPRIEEAFGARLDESLAPRDPSVLLQVVRELDLRPTAGWSTSAAARAPHAFRLATHFGFRVLGIDPVQRHLDLAREARRVAGARHRLARLLRARHRDARPGARLLDRPGLVPRRARARRGPGGGDARVRPRAAPRRVRRQLHDGRHRPARPGGGRPALRRDGGRADLGRPARARRRDRRAPGSRSSRRSTSPASGASGRRSRTARRRARCSTWRGCCASPSATAPSSATRRTT